MTCPQIQSLLEDYLDRELPETAASTVAEHLSQCAGCRAELEASEALGRLLGSLAPSEPSPEYWDEVTSLILARTEEAEHSTKVVSVEAQRSQARASLVQSLLAVAASLIVFFSALFAGSMNSETATSPANYSDGPLTKASLVAMTCRDVDSQECADGQSRLARSVILMGRPGLVGGSADLINTLGLE